MMVENICGQPMPSPHSGSLWSAQIPSLPFQGRWLGKAETERSHQICDDLSVSLRLTAPLGGEPWMVHIPQMRINSRNRKKDDKRRKKRDSKV